MEVVHLSDQHQASSQKVTYTAQISQLDHIKQAQFRNKFAQSRAVNVLKALLFLFLIFFVCLCGGFGQADRLGHVAVAIKYSHNSHL